MADNEQILQTAEIEAAPEVAEAPAPKKKLITKDLVKCVVVLAAIALVAGILLGVMNWLTYVDPDAAIIKKVSAYYSVSDANVVKNEARVVNESGKKSLVNSCFVAKDDAGETLGFCYYSVGSGAKDGTIELLVYIDKDGVIKEIAVYEQGETAGYFKKVENANKSKYVGIDVDTVEGLTLIGSKETADAEGEVAAVSNATYTSTGYHNAVAAAVYSYKNYKEA